MADIESELFINATIERVFAGISTPSGLDTWWTKSSSGTPGLGEMFDLDFGPGHEWRAQVSRYEPPTGFELQLTTAHEDWLGTRVNFELSAQDNGQTRVKFRHTGWPQANEHWRVSCYCWPAYLRLLRRNLERGEFVPYEQRLDA